MRLRTMARRLMSRPWFAVMRRARTGLCLWLALACGQPLGAQTLARTALVPILQAEFTGPTTRYAHGVLGDAVEWSGLKISFIGAGSDADVFAVTLPRDHVFEDLQPRLVDLDLDGHPDAVMVIETDVAQGAALALYGAAGKITQTPHIGRRNRWLAPIGAADLDGDGHIELAYIDRPHLAKRLRIWRYDGAELHELASKPGLTNHRIGDDFITSGLRVCGAGASQVSELVTVDAQWRRLMASRLVAGQIETRDIGAFSGSASLKAALECS